MNPIPDTIWIVKAKMLKPGLEQVWAIDYFLPGDKVARRLIAKESEVPALISLTIQGIPEVAEHTPAPAPATP